MRKVIAIVALLGTWLPLNRVAVSGPAVDRVAQARRHYKQGRAHYLRGQYRQALVQFTKARTLSPHPVLLFTLGQCHRLLKEYAKALLYYKRYLAERPRAANRAEVRRFITAMAKKSAARSRTRQLGRLRSTR